MPENFPVSTEELRRKIFDDMCLLAEMYLRDGDVDSTLHWLETSANLGNQWANKRY